MQQSTVTGFDFDFDFTAPGMDAFDWQLPEDLVPKPQPPAESQYVPSLPNTFSRTEVARRQLPHCVLAGRYQPVVAGHQPMVAGHPHVVRWSGLSEFEWGRR